MSTTLIIGGKERCGARKGDGRRCRNIAGRGTGHVGVGPCSNHTGSTPVQELNGAIQLARRDAALHARPLHIDPYTALLELIYIAAGEVQYYADRVAELPEHELIGHVVTTVERPLSEGKDGEDPDVTVTETTTGPPAEHVLKRLQHEAEERLERRIRLAGALNIAERRTRLAEQEGALMVIVIKGVLSDHGITDPDPAIVRRHLAAASARRLALGAAA